ncbi:MAG: hypothetical protein MUP85_09645 [Candidatus Lokiarchaeota archaeon]|nr:hypothetical protein [Candidatus Lokiarchaeota archaeon]
MCELANKIFSDPIVFLTALIALETFLYMVFTALMWLSMKNSINISKQNFEATNRPFVGISDSDVKFVDNGYLNPYFKCVNFGNVPAKEIFFELIVTLNTIIIHNFELSLNNIFPSNDSMWADVFESDFKSMISPQDSFTLKLNIFYCGVTKTKYTTTELYKYDYTTNNFTTVESIWN